MESGGQGFGGGGSDMPPPAPMGGAGYGNEYDNNLAALFYWLTRSLRY